jgi:hypothetical protein
MEVDKIEPKENKSSYNPKEDEILKKRIQRLGFKPWMIPPIANRNAIVGVNDEHTKTHF